MRVEPKEPSRLPEIPSSDTLIFEGQKSTAVPQILVEADKTPAERRAIDGIRTFIQGLKENGARTRERIVGEIYLHDGDPQKALTVAYLKGLEKVFGPFIVFMQEDLDRLKKTAEASNGVEKLVLKSLAGVLSLEIGALRWILGSSQDQSHSLFAQREQLRAERKASKPGGKNDS